MKTVIAAAALLRLRRLAKGFALETTIDGQTWTLIERIEGKAAAMDAFAAERDRRVKASEEAEAARLAAATPAAKPAKAKKAPKAKAPKVAPTKEETTAKKANSAMAQWDDAVKRSRLIAGFVAKRLCPGDHFRSEARKLKVDVLSAAMRQRGEEAVKAVFPKGTLIDTPEAIAAALNAHFSRRAA